MKYYRIVTTSRVFDDNSLWLERFTYPDVVSETGRAENAKYGINLELLS